MDSRLNNTITVLRVAIGLMATLAGLDKFFNLLTNWEAYVAPAAQQFLPFSAGAFMGIVGVIEFAVGITILAIRPSLGALIASAWLILVAANLVLGGYFDIAVRDVVLAISAYTLARLEQARAGQPVVASSTRKGLVTAAIVGALLAVASPSFAADRSATLHQDMRKLWTDHTVWTRDYIVAAVDDRPDAQAAANRLMKNQEDIGNAVAAYYGQAAGQQLTSLLKQHIVIAVDLIKAAKAGDKAAQQQASDKWQQNAVDIATFLSKANPNWPKDALVNMMKMHLSTTTDEVVARLKHDYEADVRAYDAVYNHILMMADALSDGIVKQFPDKFKAS
ncbi:MAG TPA: hypothetical protein VL693_10285 [Vicinamibacterales bacterium]|jgi:hypothetical protein|nr:hypothetical protein [Vicinamibacterales bacterium]